ncbi:organ-specific protein, partial [Ralstonia pseudosolanacearum]|uniref:organ-specific protein n=1 Tax=Ralstonia pseudosolanacearum TaxID=1310165 RepID=UPI003CF3A7B1
FCLAMKSLSVYFGLFSVLLLFVITEEARQTPNEYWNRVTKEQTMRDARDDVLSNPELVPNKERKADCHTPTEKEEKSFLENFEPRPNVSVYHDDSETSEGKTFVKDFEPRPNVSVYHDDSESKAFVKDFEPRPNISVYHD